MNAIISSGPLIAFLPGRDKREGFLVLPQTMHWTQHGVTKEAPFAGASPYFRQLCLVVGVD